MIQVDLSEMQRISQHMWSAKSVRFCWLVATTWTVAQQVPLHEDSPGKNSSPWGCHSLLPTELFDQGIELTTLMSPTLCRFTWTTECYQTPYFNIYKWNGYDTSHLFHRAERKGSWPNLNRYPEGKHLTKFNIHSRF